MRSCSTKYFTTLRSSRSVPGVSASRFAWFSRILEEAIAQAVPPRCLLVSTTVDRLVRSGEAAQELVDMTSSAGRHSPQLQQGKRNANRVSHEGGECAGDIQQTSRSHRQYGRVDCQNLRSVEASGGFFTRSQDEGNVTALSNNWADRFPDHPGVGQRATPAGSGKVSVNSPGADKAADIGRSLRRRNLHQGTLRPPQWYSLASDSISEYARNK
jgi:hypothetical protein